MKQKDLVILSGIPGSGKSTWLRTHLGDGDAYVSRDEVRFSTISDNEDYFSHETEVFDKFVAEIEAKLNEGKRVFADATHINWASRRKLLERIRDKKNINIDVYMFTASLETCLARNTQRTGRALVPEGVIRRMYKQLTNPATDPFNYRYIITIDTETIGTEGEMYRVVGYLGDK